ncbi:hypothetical protein [Devosia sp.]|uniref:hypothetical protein n=1 Tax=Devosia sp. TaxID=1871048 RepID=UPI002930A159|nr:hypothetical protein [Devosia sp.]
MEVLSLKRFIGGMDPEKMSTNVLRFYNGCCANVDGNKIYKIAGNNLDVDLTTTGVNGRDPAYPLVNGSYWAPIVIGRNSDDEPAIVMTGGGGWSEITLPSGYHFVRKLPFGFVYNSAWDGIPNFHLSYWPKPHIRFTDAQDSSPWIALNAGTASTWTDIAMAGWLPDAARVVHVIASARYIDGSAGSAYLRSHAGQPTGINVGSVSPSSLYSFVATHIRVDSLRKLQYKCTGNARLYLQVIGYDMTEPS